MNNKEFMTALALRWKSKAVETKKWVGQLIRVLGECFDEGYPVAIEGLGIFVIIKHRERIVVEKEKRILVPPLMELQLLAPERLPEISTMTTADLARMMADSNGTDVDMEENRIKSFFDILIKSVDVDLMVRVSGLGSFKAVSTKEVPVLDADTGQTVVTMVHDGLSYTADKTMRDLVNRPFAQFVPVQLKDGVVFEDMEKEYEPEMLLGPQKAPAVMVVEEENPAAEAAPEETPITADTVTEPEPKSEVADTAVTPTDATPIPEKTPEAVPEIQLPQEPSATETPADTLMLDDGDAGHGYRKKSWWLIPLVAAIAAFILLVPKNKKVEEKPAVVAEKTDSVVAEPKLDLDALNSQYPYGAYEIIGIDTTVVVRPGESLEWISKVQIGPGLEPYIQIINGGIETIKEGDTLLIPKLQLKKQFRK